MQANWALVQWFPGLDEFPCELRSSSGSLPWVC